MEKYGFVYIWFDRKHKRYYIGSHWGTEDDGYICSSSWMKQAYKIRPQDFRRKIIQRIYDRSSLLQNETKWLSMIKESEIGHRYYNLHNGKQGHWHTSDNARKSATEKMKSSLNETISKMSPEERSKKFGHWKGKVSPNKGNTTSEETKNKIREANIGKKHSTDTIEKMKKRTPWNKGLNDIYSEETRRKIGEASKGKTRAPVKQSTRDKISKAKKGVKLSDQHKLALSKSHLGKGCSKIRKESFEMRK